MSGFSCPDSEGEDLNGHYEYVAMTSDGRPIYASASSAHYLFYDASCGDGSDAPWSSGWFVDSAFPNLLAWSQAPTNVPTTAVPTAAPSNAPTMYGYKMDDTSIRTAVAEWLADAAAAEATYGHIST